MGANRNRSFPYENDEFDILVGTLDEDDTVYGPGGDDTGDGGDGPGNSQDSTRDEDGATYGFEDANDAGFEDIDVLSFNFQSGDDGGLFFVGPNNDTFKGGKGIDTFYSGGGEDHIYGGENIDWLFGEDGNDEIFGQGDGDWLFGGDHHDTLHGGEGGDHLSGGADSDDFVFTIQKSFVQESPASVPDTILDFKSLYDQITLHGSQLEPGEDTYVEVKLYYDVTYDQAKDFAMSLLEGDKTYAFVTDGTDGFLFMEPWSSNEETTGLDTVGIILEGLTTIDDFKWQDVMAW